MFSGAPGALGYAVVLSDGSVQDVDLGEHLVNVRLDVPLDGVLPDRLRERTPDGEAVVIRRMIGGPEEVPCA